MFSTDLATCKSVEINDRRQISDRRRASRRKMLKGARTFWPNGDSSECIVHNLSDTGAHLQMRGPAPNAFDLLIDGNEEPQSCNVVWRNANRVGVKFQDRFGTERPLEKAIGKVASFKHYAAECRLFAKQADPCGRQTLLKMAEAWETVIRRFRKNIRLAAGAL